MTSEKIFVSHSSSDKDIVDAFVDDILICGLGFQSNEIFYASGEGMGIDSGEDWRLFIKEKLIVADVVFLIITPNYKSSEICMNEMGASWATDALVLPMIVEPINYKTVGVLADVKQVEKLNSSIGLDNIYEQLTRKFPKVILPKVAKWNNSKAKFLNIIKTSIVNNPFPDPICKDTFAKLKEEIKDLKIAKDTLRGDNDKMKKYIEVLESKKDATDIVMTKREVGLLSKVDEFEALLAEVGRLLKPFDSAIVTLIFNDYTDNKLEVSHYLYKHELEKAKANKFLDQDYDVIWDKKKEMQKLLSSLQKLKECIKGLDEENYSFLMNEYDSLDIEDLSFWTNVIGAKIIT